MMMEERRKGRRSKGNTKQLSVGRADCDYWENSVSDGAHKANNRGSDKDRDELLLSSALHFDPPTPCPPSTLFFL